MKVLGRRTRDTGGAGTDRGHESDRVGSVDRTFMYRRTLAVSLGCLLLCTAPFDGAGTALAAALGPVVFIPSLPADTLPPWRYDEMTRVVVEQAGEWEASDVESLELLAWYAVVDDRPWYVNVALFGVRLSGGRWALAQIGQNPIPDRSVTFATASRRMDWNWYRITDVDWEPGTVFKGKPSPEAVDRYLRFWGDFRGYRFLSHGFRARTWQAFWGLPAPARLKERGDEPRK